jgi:sugar phosphate isomerase/epimerase
MRIGVLTALYQDLPFEEALDKAAAAGVTAVEIGSGGYPGSQHCPVDELLESQTRRDEYMEAIASRGLMLSALSCHNNPIHPDPEVAKLADDTIHKSVTLAAQLGVPVVNGFSGLPAGTPGDRMPNWVTCPWPPHFTEMLDYQWNQVAIPYWREAAGAAIGCNFDPSHLFWNGVDPVAAIRKLGEAIYHVHGKDVYLDPLNISVNGCNDHKSYSEIAQRSWTFRTIGYGHGLKVWKDIMSAFRLVGYDYVVSIEHEDALMSSDEGLSKAVATLKEATIFEQSGEMFWA